MSKKLFIALLLLLTASFVVKASGEPNNNMLIELRVYNDDSQETENPRPRTPPHPTIYAELQGCDLIFPPFSVQCTLEIVDADTDTKIYTTSIPAGNTTCQIPLLGTGTYQIRFVFDDITYWGTFEL